MQRYDVQPFYDGTETIPDEHGTWVLADEALPRIAALEAKIAADEKRFLLAWDALDAGITFLRTWHSDAPTGLLIATMNDAKHGVGGRVPLAALTPEDRK